MTVKRVKLTLSIDLCIFIVFRCQVEQQDVGWRDDMLCWSADDGVWFSRVHRWASQQHQEQWRQQWRQQLVLGIWWQCSYYCLLRQQVWQL